VVAAKPELDNGGKATTGDWSVSSVMSHEVLEMFIDPNCNLKSGKLARTRRRLEQAEALLAQVTA
jgi:hypothetical protein